MMIQFKQKTGKSKRSIPEIKILTTTLNQSYNKFHLINENKKKIFFKRLHDDCYGMYAENMQSVFNTANSHFEYLDLLKLHNIFKMKSLAQVSENLIFFLPPIVGIIRIQIVA